MAEIKMYITFATPKAARIRPREVAQSVAQNRYRKQTTINTSFNYISSLNNK
jgi:hypothetical protein